MRRCAECFKEIADKKARCSHCGFDNSKIKPVLGAIKSGRLIDERYYIGSVLGQGGFGITYKAFDVDLERILAIKEYYPKNSVQRSDDGFNVQPSDQQEFKKGLNYFTDEAKALARFQGHPNIVSVQNYFRSNNTAYMVMEFMEGKTVREILRGGKTLPTPDSIKIILGVLEGLIACHKQNLIHRDLTPDNVYITTKSQVKILDFGSARQTKEGEDNEFTQILKESYAPIEQYQKSGAQGPYTDIYSVGASFYRLLTGKPPPDNATDRIIEDKLKRPSQLNPNLVISEDVENVLMKAMAVKPNDRYQTVESFKKDLIEAINNPNAKQARSEEKVSQQKPISKSKPKQPSESKQKQPYENKPKQSSIVSKRQTSAEIKPEPLRQAPEVIKDLNEENKPKSKPQVKPEQEGDKKTLPVGAIVGVAASLVLFIGYQIMNPSVTDPLDQKTIQEITQNQKPKDTITRIDLSPESYDISEEDEPVPDDKEKLVNLDKYELKVNVYPDNIRSTVKILETKDPYFYGQVLNEGSYSVQISASGYRTKILRNTELNRNRIIDVDLEKLRTLNVSAMNEFFALVKNPTKSRSDYFKEEYKSHAPLSQLFDVFSNNQLTIKELKRLAKNGDAESNFILGVAEVEGFFGKNSNLQNARSYLQTAYDQNYKNASIWLALSYSCVLNQASDCNEKKTIQLLEANSFDLPLSDYFHARILFTQNKNLNKASILAEAASKAGVVDATYLIGDLAFKEGNLSKSSAYWKVAADEGNTSAMVRLASLQMQKSDSDGIKWLRKAYENGDKQAGIFLAIEAGERNPESFFKLAESLSKQKVNDGHFLTGWAYLKGIGTKLNLSESLKNFSSCSNQNCRVMSSIVSYRNSPARTSVGDYLKILKVFNTESILKQLLPDVKGELYFELGKSSLKFNEKDSKDALFFLEESTKYANVKAFELLCSMAIKGKGVRKNESLALSHCNEAATLNSLNSITYNTIGDLLSKGVDQRRGNIPIKEILSAYRKSCQLKDGSGCCNLAKIYHDQKNYELRDTNINLAKQHNFSHCKTLIDLR